MLKSLPDLLWAFDCECIPDIARGRLVYKLPKDSTDREVLEHMWKAGGADEKNPEPFLKLILSRIVSVAILSREVKKNGDIHLDLHALPGDGKALEEGKLIERFLNGIGKKQPQLVGFNSHEADLPIILQRALCTGVTSPEFAKRPNKPWEGYDYFSKSSEAHIDIRTQIGTWGKGNPSLHELAVSCGIPGKLDVDGNQVRVMWDQGKIKEIVDYNECDAVTTYLVWLRMAYFSGYFTPEEYKLEQERVEVLLKNQVALGKEHLLHYLEVWTDLRSQIETFN
jgi:predicted PolB exonuclease-like 3'-5' exonuclease